MGRTIKKQFWLNSKEAERGENLPNGNGAGAAADHRL